MPANSMREDILPPNAIGSFKYAGKLVEDGTIEARAASRALAGIDSAVRYFVAQEDPTLGAIDFPLPVQTRKGSWETLIPQTIGGWIMTAAGLGISAYITAAGKQLAQNGFKDETISSVVQKALKAVQALIMLGKHLGHLEIRRITNVKWPSDETIRISNERGETLDMPAALWKKLAACPVTLLSDVASVIEEERTLVVSVRIGDAVAQVSVSKRERHIFLVEEDELDEILFPELVHGAPVALEGIVTRENGRTKTLGFLYKDHVLTCMPASGNILPFKRNLFLRCRMHGQITRKDANENPTEKRPKVIFTDLEILSDKEQLALDFHDDIDEES